MDDKLVSCLIESSCGFKARNVGPVAEFCLTVASYKVNLADIWHPTCLLLLTAEVSDGKLKHSFVQTKPWQLALKWHPPLNIRVLETRIVLKPLIS